MVTTLRKPTPRPGAVLFVFGSSTFEAQSKGVRSLWILESGGAAIVAPAFEESPYSTSRACIGVGQG